MLQYHFLTDPKSPLPQLRRWNRLYGSLTTIDVADEVVRLRLGHLVGRCVMSLASEGSLSSMVHAMVVTGVEVPGPFRTRMITSVLGLCGRLGGILCEGTRWFVVAVCGSE